ncbi:MAG: hypothetical protein ACREJ2_11680 [Planctomycetota bacterium]
MNIATLGAAVNLLASVAEATQVISSLISDAASSGRTTLTDAEWGSITAAADKAHQALEATLAGSGANANESQAGSPA